MHAAIFAGQSLSPSPGAILREVHEWTSIDAARELLASEDSPNVSMAQWRLMLASAKQICVMAALSTSVLAPSQVHGQEQVVQRLVGPVYYCKNVARDSSVTLISYTIRSSLTNASDHVLRLRKYREESMSYLLFAEPDAIDEGKAVLRWIPDYFGSSPRSTIVRLHPQETISSVDEATFRIQNWDQSRVKAGFYYLRAFPNFTFADDSLRLDDASSVSALKVEIAYPEVMTACKTGRNKR